MSAKLQKTTNYDLFFPNPNQRTYKPRQTEKLVRKMKSNGFPPSMAISCYRNRKGVLAINTGHHRLEAARILGIPVWYVIEHEWTTFELVSEGTSARNFDTLASAQSYASDGANDYITLLYYAKKGMPIRFAASMLMGQHAASGNASDAISDGIFKVKTTDHIDEVCRVIDELRPINKEAGSQSFISALSALLIVDEFDANQLITRIKAVPSQLEKRSTRDQMLEQLEEIYNFRSRVKANIAFAAKNLLKNRKMAFGRSSKPA